MQTHAVVRWCSKDNIIVNYVEISAIDDKKLGLVEEEFYSVKWLDNKKYKAQLIFLGRNYFNKKLSILIFCIYFKRK